MITSGLFSSATPEWATPQDLYNTLDAEFGFELDPCATHDNHKAPRYYTKEDDGLAQDWGTLRTFINPPYGREIGKWVRRAREHAEGGARGRPAPGTHGHRLVGGRHESRRDTLHKGPRPLRRSIDRRTIPLLYRDMGHTEGADDQGHRQTRGDDMSKKKDQIDKLMDYLGRCYKTTMDDLTAYSQVSGIIVEDGAPAQEPLEITHIIHDPGRVIFRRGRLAPEDLAPGLIGQQEITADEYAEELCGILSAYRPIDIPTKDQRTAMRRAIRGTP